MKKAINKNLYDFNSPFPTIFRKLIEEHGTKQDVIAEKCNVKRQTVAQWKDGNTCPDILSLKKIAEFYNVSTDYLLGLSTNPTTNEASKSLCKTLGLSDVAIHILKNDDSQKLRDAINFLFGNYYYVYTQSKEKETIQKYEFNDSDILKDYSILSELANFIAICRERKDIMLLLDNGNLFIQSYNENGFHELVTEAKTTNIKNVCLRHSLLKLSAKECAENISDIFDEILENSISQNIDRKYLSKLFKERGEDEAIVSELDSETLTFNSIDFFVNQKIYSNDFNTED